MDVTALPTSWAAWLGGYAGAAVLSAGAAFALFRLFSDKWLTARFDERLSAYKHAQQRELEHLKLEVNTLLDRTVKLHQREFDVLPEVWGRLTDAYYAVRPVGLGLMFYPDVNRLSQAQLDNLIEKSGFDDWQKDELRAAPDKTRYYGDAMAHMNRKTAHAAWADFDIYFTRNAIFIPEPIKGQFSAFSTLMYEVLTEQQLQSGTGSQRFEKGLRLHEKGPGMLKTLERDVQARLWTTPPPAS